VRPPNPAVLVIGAGPAGLAAAHALAERDVHPVLVVDRDDQAGGLPRYCHHLGFGWEYSRRLESGPAFARRLLGALDPARVRVLTQTTALAIHAGPAVDLVGPSCGAITLRPQAIVVATGLRERPRAARLVPGRRPERGVLTTGQLQQMVMRGVPIDGRRAVVVGTEHVAFSVLLTARRVGLSVIAMVEPQDRVMSYAPVATLVRWFVGVATQTNTEVAGIHGDQRVEAIELNGPRGRETIPCDTVIFTGDFVPDAPMLRSSGMVLDPRTGGPEIDQLGRSSMPGVFAAGNVLRAVETSGFAAIEGARVGAAAARFVNHGKDWRGNQRRFGLAAELSYVVPQLWSPTPPGDDALPASLRARVDIDHGRIALRQGATVLWQGRNGRMRRHRRIRLALDRMRQVGASAEPIAIEVMR